MIETTSGVNPRGKPFVTLAWGQEAAPLTPDAARRPALTLLETAEAAEIDAPVFDRLGVVVGTDPALLSPRAGILAAFRTHREAARAKGEGP